MPASQKLLRFRQGQSQVSNIAKTFRPADLYQMGAQAAGITLCRNQPHTHRITIPPVGY